MLTTLSINPGRVVQLDYTCNGNDVDKLEAGRRQSALILVQMERAWVRIITVLLLAGAIFGVYWVQAHRGRTVPTIAVIPQAAGTLLWDVERLGATVAAEKLKAHIYWNAPTSENDFAGQISLIDKVARGDYQGLVIAPNHPLVTLAPLRRAVEASVPVVIVSTPLDMPANDKVGFIVNDDEKMGEIAAAEISRLVGGNGSIALLGLARYTQGIRGRTQSAERFLAERFPGIRVVTRLTGTYDASRSQELTDGVLDSYPDLKAILCFTSASTRGAHAALKARSLQKTVHLVGCEQDSDLVNYVRNGEIAAIVAQNTYRMGYMAVQLIGEYWRGKPMPARSVITPMLLTIANLRSDETSVYISPGKP